jgi:hypothetical protein
VPTPSRRMAIIGKASKVKRNRSNNTNLIKRDNFLKKKFFNENEKTIQQSNDGENKSDAILVCEIQKNRISSQAA